MTLNGIVQLIQWTQIYFIWHNQAISMNSFCLSFPAWTHKAYIPWTFRVDWALDPEPNMKQADPLQHPDGTFNISWRDKRGLVQIHKVN